MNHTNVRFMRTTIGRSRNLSGNVCNYSQAHGSVLTLSNVSVGSKTSFVPIRPFKKWYERGRDGRDLCTHFPRPGEDQSILRIPSSSPQVRRVASYMKMQPCII